MGGKNIALLFSGQLRCHKKIIDAWKYFFINPLTKEFNVTIFFETSDENLNEIQEIVDEYSDYNVIYSLSKDTDYKNELPNIFLLPPSGLFRGGHNQLIREFHSMDKVFKLLEEHSKKIKFDYIFRTRPDVIPLSIFDVNILKNINVSNFLYIGNHDHHSGLNSRFILCDYETGKIVFNIIEKMKSITQNDIKLFGGEPYWLYHIQQICNIDYNLLNYKVGLVRDYDDRFPRNEWGKITCDGVTLGTFNYDEKKIKNG